MLRTHGITRDPEMFETASEGVWHYEMHTLGLNYRMTDISAALGISQLRKLHDFVFERQEIATFYRGALDSIKEVGFQSTPAYAYSARHLFVIHVDSDRRRFLFDGLRASGVGVNLHYIPITEHPYYKKLGFKTSAFPHSDWHAQSSISLPIFPGLPIAAREFVVDRIKSLLG